MEEINEKNVLIKTFIKIIKKLDSDKYDWDLDIKDFLDIFEERNLYEKCEITENKADIWKNLINLLIYFRIYFLKGHFLGNEKCQINLKLVISKKNIINKWNYIWLKILKKL